ncbi:MAG: DUF1269 domain-containing protein [Ilumatobacter sp.]|nr:DUF1269 domain-containing protein [Ilumatobacter sp.]
MSAPSDNTQGAEALGSDGPTPEGSPVADPDSDPGAMPPPAPVGDPAARSRQLEPGMRTDPDAPMLVGVAFDQPLKAQEYLIAMSRLRSDGSLQLKDAVIVTKDADGDIKVTETIDPTPGRSALSGAMWTGLLGLIVGGPVGWLAGMGIGAGAGAVTAKVVDLGIPDEWVDWFKEAVRPGTSAVVILAEEVDVRALEREAERFRGAELIESTLPAAAIRDLEAAFERR